MNITGNQRGAVLRKLARAVVSLSTMLATMLLALGLGVPAPAEAQTQGVTLKADINYSGASLQLTTNVADLSTLGFNDRTSSVQVPLGTVVAAFDAGNFLGRCETFRADDPDLRNNIIGNDTISSLWVGRACPVLLFDGNNYTGSVFSVSGDLPDFGARFSNVMSSMKLQGSAKVALFDEPHYGGLCEVFTADDPSFDTNPIRERASSLRFGVDCPQQAVLFSDVNYGGDAVALPFGEYFWTHLGSLGMQNRASSIYLSGGAYLDTANVWQELVRVSLFAGYTETHRVEQRFTESHPDLRLSVVGNDTIDEVRAYR